MKKITSLVVAFAVLGVLGFASASVAANDIYSATGSITVGTNDGGTPATLVIGLSPKVVARYINPGTTDATAQWYSIATAHPGGNLKFATAQDLNNLYQKSFTTGTALSSAELNIPATSQSASVWSDNSWVMQ